MRAVIFDLDHTVFKTDNTLHDGVEELLSILVRLGIRIGGISNADHRTLVRISEAGISDHFTKILCSDQAFEPKGVAGVHHLLSLLEVVPQESALVSHAHADILLAKDAGLLKSIGVTHSQDIVFPLEEAGADYIVTDIPEVLDVLE